jgi:hypothetical protein
MIGEAEKFKLSERVTVDVAVLDGFESDQAEMILADLLPAPGNTEASAANFGTKYALLTAKVYALCSVRAVNGEAINPLKNVREYIRTAQMLTAKERDGLNIWAAPHYNPDPVTLKNESAADEGRSLLNS